MADSDTLKKHNHFYGDGRGDEHPLGHLGQFVSLVAFLVVWGLDSFVLRFSTFLAPSVPLALRLAVAGLIAAIAVYFSLKGHVVVQGGPDHPGRPVRDGAFARVRNPIYLGSLLFYIGLAISTLSLLALAVFESIFLFYNYIASYEERRLVQIYGDVYRDYRRKVPKWIPRLRPARFGPLNGE